MDISLYLHTVRHLKPGQVVGRAIRLLRRNRPSCAPAPERRAARGAWTESARREPSMLGPSRFRILNDVRELDGAAGWNDRRVPKLWLYHLHYFDDLGARGSEERKDWHASLIRRWVEENPPARGCGWEPYPLSLRIVNWIKWTLRGGALEEGALHSLAVQARQLRSTLEFHLLGNHLFANAKALVFAGMFFQGKEAGAWLRKGAEILRREVREQILRDGGHFERSPMYHSIILEDLLDLVNLDRAYGGRLREESGADGAEWNEAIGRMRRWLGTMCHPDGDFALFNDSAFGIAPAPDELEAYAVRLGFGGKDPPQDGLTHLAESGYIRLQGRDAVLLLDVGELGPDYLPGHGHADSLSFELSLHGRRVVVDTGVSRYERGPDRLFERGTKAHNTVVVDGEDSSEVWGSFRVARRAKPFGLKIEERGDEISVECAHDGYLRLPGRAVHRRRWILSAGRLRIEDFLEGTRSRGQSRLLLHPDVAERSGGKIVFGKRVDAGEWELHGGRPAKWRLERGRGEFERAEYHPEFGVAVPTARLLGSFSEDRIVFELFWS